jgi:hypothetical protein
MRRGEIDMPASLFTKASVRSAILGVTESGLQPSAMEFLADGSMRFEFSEAISERTIGSTVGLYADQEPPTWEDAL